MAESSLYRQRLEAIVGGGSSPASFLRRLQGRRAVQERILRTRRELEEEKLRAQQLKRKSLRDRWLMEGTCLPLEENDPTSPLQQTQSRIQELERDLSSLECQMQQLDNPEPQGRPQEDPKQPAGDTCEALGAGSAAVANPGEGGCSNGTEPALCLAPVPPKRATQAAPQEILENGDVSGAVERFGPGPFETEASSAAPRTPGTWAQPLDNGVGATTASAMIIRNHLGQEVGSMDAIRRMPLEPEEEAPGAENGSEEWDGSREGEQQVLDGGMEEKMPVMAVLEESMAGEGSREGPEGASWVPEGEAQALADENCCLDSQRPQPDGELEELITVVEEGEISAEPSKGMEEEEDGGAARGSAAEAELGPAQGRGPVGQDCAREEKRQECPGAEHHHAGVVGEGAETKASQNKQSPGNQIPSDLQDQISLSYQGQIPSFQEAEAALRDQISSVRDQISSVQDQISCSVREVKELLRDQLPAPLQEAEASVQDQIQIVQYQIPSSLLEGKTSLQDQIPSSLLEANTALLDQIPSVQDQIPSPLLEGKASVQDQIPSVQDQIPSSLQEANTAFQAQIPSVQDQIPSVQNEIPSSLQEANTALQDQIPPPQEAKADLQDQIPSMQVQVSSALQEANTALQDQIPSAVQGAQASLQDQIPSTVKGAQASLQDQIPSPQESKHALESQIPSSQEQVSALYQEAPLTQGELPSGAPTLDQAPALPGKSVALKGGSNIGPISSAAEETTENLGKLSPEEQPLLSETSGICMGRREPLGSAAKSPQQGASTKKSQAATISEAVTYSTSSANTASPCQGRSTPASQPGDGQETGRRKQKTCQCCSVM